MRNEILAAVVVVVAGCSGGTEGEAGAPDMGLVTDESAARVDVTPRGEVEDDAPCEPACDGPSGPKECGDDGCGGSCGECGWMETCAGGACESVCLPFCENIECGPDGCGGSCGQCPADLVCRSGLCQPGCEASCDGECGDDGCGGSCGKCEDGLVCAGGSCVEEGSCMEVVVTCSVIDGLPVPPEYVCAFIDAYPDCFEIISRAFLDDGCASECSVWPIPGLDEACVAPACKELLETVSGLVGIDVCSGCE